MRKILLFLFIIGMACSSSEPVVINKPSEPDETETGQTTFESATNYDVSEYNVVQYQSSLSDVYSNKTNEIPEAYARLSVEQEEETDEFEGYRVQIYSGQEVAMADTLAMRFRAWSDTTITGYQAETYTFFKAPYYRVHVGDFHDRERAIYFSNLLKRRFRDAWVVYDRVNPWNVPSDTTYIYIE
jgi:hypothetical protein